MSPHAYSRCHVTSNKAHIPSQIPRIACGGRSFLTLVLQLLTPSNPPPCLKFVFCAFKVTLGLVRSYVTLAIKRAILTPTKHENGSNNIRRKKKRLKQRTNLSWMLSSLLALTAHVRWVPCHHGMTRPQGADEGDALQVRREAANIFNKQ
jgi:hypothetical protein